MSETHRSPGSPTSFPRTVLDGIELLHHWAAADDALETEAALIIADVSSSSRVSQGTVDRLEALLGARLRPGVQARAAFTALPPTVRRDAIAEWAARAVDRAAPLPARTAVDAVRDTA